MDKNKLRELIEQVAIIKDVGTDVGPSGIPLTGVRKARPKKIIETVINEFGEEKQIEVEMVTSNSTLGYIIDELKDNYRLCELGCGEMVNNQQIYKRLVHTPENHWRTQCVNCKKVIGPDGELIYGTLNVQRAFSAHFSAKQNK